MACAKSGDRVDIALRGDRAQVSWRLVDLVILVAVLILGCVMPLGAALARAGRIDRRAGLTSRMRVGLRRILTQRRLRRRKLRLLHRRRKEGRGAVAVVAHGDE